MLQIDIKVNGQVHGKIQKYFNLLIVSCIKPASYLSKGIFFFIHPLENLEWGFINLENTSNPVNFEMLTSIAVPI